MIFQVIAEKAIQKVVFFVMRIVSQVITILQECVGKVAQAAGLMQGFSVIQPIQRYLLHPLLAIVLLNMIIQE